MIWITVLAVAAGLAVAAFLIFVDQAAEKLFDRILTMLGLQSGKGPLVVSAEPRAEDVAVTIRNDSRAQVRLAAVEAKAASGRSFPVPWTEPTSRRAGEGEEEARRAFAGRTLAAGESLTVYLDRSELDAAQSAGLAVLDSRGRPSRHDRRSSRRGVARGAGALASEEPPRGLPCSPLCDRPSP